MPQHLWIKMANLVFELEKKLPAQGAPTGVSRNIDRMKAVLEEAGLMILNPMGEPYAETRTDLEVNITGTGKGALHVLDVIKPVIYSKKDGAQSLLQKGVVIAGYK
jgi:hypothetical protein